MRRLWFNAGLVPVLAATACTFPVAQPPASPGPSAGSTPATPGRVNPENLRRVRPEFPAGYEVQSLPLPATPAALWGLKAGWTAHPLPCGVLAQPAAESEPTQGLSGSGQGGIVYAVVADVAGAAVPGPDVLDPCARWSMASGNTTAAVELVGVPPIPEAGTIGMVSTVQTVVEGGTKTDSAAHTATAYVDDHVVFVAVVTDPGSAEPQLPPEFAADFLGKTVAALRR